GFAVVHMGDDGDIPYVFPSVHLFYPVKKRALVRFIPSFRGTRSEGNIANFIKKTMGKKGSTLRKGQL
ncbi:MAG: hypothetical protein L0Y74_03420, partial [candidate division Zixibacteria bacterium]|nr:hypothetical protein [candidate division Zixibacteria bacterium]